MGAIPLGVGMFLGLRSNDTQRNDALNKSIAMLGKTGTTVMAREDAIWSTTQPTEGGAYDWTEIDHTVKLCSDAGVEAWLILAHPPAWATAPGGGATSGWPCPPYSNLLTAGSNNALTAYAAFCGAAAARYAAGGTFWSTYVGTPIPVRYFEVWNEEYTTLTAKIWNGSSAVQQYSDPVKYAAIYNAAATQIHLTAGAKAAASLCYNTWNSSPVGAAYLQPFLTNVTQPVEVASVHPYPEGQVYASYNPSYTPDRWKKFSQVADTRFLLNTNGYTTTQVWITELGWWTGAVIPITEAEQANRYSDLWAKLQADQIVDGLIIFCATNPSFPDNSALPGYDANNAECFFALWHTGATAGDIGSAKPAVATITALPAIIKADPVSATPTAVTPQVLMSGYVPNTTTAAGGMLTENALYQAPSATGVRVYQGSLCNITAGPVSVYLSIVRKGNDSGDGTHRAVHNFLMEPNDTLPLGSYFENTDLSSGDVIMGYASAASSVVFTISGVLIG